MDLKPQSIKKILFIITFTIFVFTVMQNLGTLVSYLQILWSILFPFVLGGAIAFILNIPMQVFERQMHRMKNRKYYHKLRKLIRPISLVLAIVFIIGILGIVLFIVAPELGRTFVTIGSNIENSLPEIQEWLINLFNDNKGISTYIEQLEVNWSSMLENIAPYLQSGAGSILSSTVSIFSSIINFFIAIIFSCYILLQKEKLSTQVKKILYACLPKEKVEKILEIGLLSHRTFSSFITGQCIEAIILGMMFVVTMTVLRIPYALLVGVLIAFTALIPIVGAFVGCVVGALLIVMQDPMQALMFIILFLILQQIEGNLIYPHVVGNSVGLPSMWVLFAVTVGNSLMGIVGMLIFIPIMSVVYVLFRTWVHKRLKQKKIQVI